MITTKTSVSAIRKFIPLTVAATLTIAACGSGSDESSDDAEDTCRTAQRLVDDAADFDEEGIDRRIDDLADVDGIDDLTDLDDVEDLLRDTDSDDLDDAVDQLNDDLDCDLDTPELSTDTETTDPVDTVEEAPVDTVAPAPTEPVDTEPETTEPETTDPVDTEPETTEPETTEQAQTGGEDADAEAGTVDIGATGPGLDRPDVIAATTDAVAESGITQIPAPAGDAGVLEYDVSYSLNTFAESPEYSASESITYIAATEMTIEDVRSAFVDELVAGGVEYDTTDSTSTQDTVSTTATSLDPVDFGEAPSYDVFVSSNSDVPGVLIVEIELRESREGDLPEYIDPAAEQFSEAIGIADGAGWEARGWRWSPGVNQFSGSPFTSGGVDWTAGTGAEADVAPLAADLLAQLPAPDFDDVGADREFYTFEDGSNWSVSFSDAFEGEELRVSYSIVI